MKILNYNARQHLGCCRAWVFDLDGTLAVARHDFSAIRRRLGLPDGMGILEAIALRPEQEQILLMQKLDKIELEIAARAMPSPWAVHFIRKLYDLRIPAAIFTRNNRPSTLETLKRCQLIGHFPAHLIITRDEIQKQKPDPEGLFLIANRLRIPAARFAVVGDFLYDLESARLAGATAIFYDPAGQFLHKDAAAICIRSFQALLQIKATSQLQLQETRPSGMRACKRASLRPERTGAKQIFRIFLAQK